MDQTTQKMDTFSKGEVAFIFRTDERIQTRSRSFFKSIISGVAHYRIVNHNLPKIDETSCYILVSHWHKTDCLRFSKKQITWNFSGNSLKFQEMNVVCQSYSQPVIFFTDILYSLQFRHQTRWISNSFTSVSYQIGGSMFLWKQNHIEAGQGKSEVIWETLTTQEQWDVVMSALHCHFSLFKYNNLQKHEICSATIMNTTIRKFSRTFMWVVTLLGSLGSSGFRSFLGLVKFTFDRGGGVGGSR